MAISVLVVDDEPALRELIAQMLKISGFAVQQAANGVDALDQIEEDPPDALVLDMMMPQMDGIALCKHLRADPETAQLPIVMVSGKTQREAIAEGLAAGANKYLCKPVSYNELIDELNEVLSEKAMS